MAYHDPIKPSERELELIKHKYYLNDIGNLCRKNRSDKIGNGKKYLRVGLITDGKRKQYALHHVVWFLYYGIWPKQEIDHKDRNTFNNHISNLQESNRPDNCSNKHKASGLPKGVCKFRRKFKAQTRINGVRINIGIYSTALEAQLAYDNYINGASK